jgi:hypothetical protein
MIFTEILNAISMFFPLAALKKHKKTRSKLKYIMVLHIPISIIYHSCRAFNIKNKLVQSLYSLDIFCIQVSSLITSLEYKKITNQNIFNHCIVSVPLHCIAYIYKDIPIYRICVIWFDNTFAFEAQNKKDFILTGFYCCLFFNLSFYFNLDICHSLFHAYLYDVYDLYFTLIG